MPSSDGVFARLGGATGPIPEGMEAGTACRWNSEKGFGFIKPDCDPNTCTQTFLWSVVAQQASGYPRPGMEPPPSLCEPCRAELEKTGSELRTCTDCSKPWVFEARDKRFFEKCAAEAAEDGRDFTIPTRCKPCRKRKKIAREEEESAQLEEENGVFKTLSKSNDDRLALHESLRKRSRSFYMYESDDNVEQRDDVESE